MKSIRYFRDKDSYWKFEAGKPALMKEGYDSIWKESYFVDVEEFLLDPGEVEEVSRDEVERTTTRRTL